MTAKSSSFEWLVIVSCTLTSTSISCTSLPALSDDVAELFAKEGATAEVSHATDGRKRRNDESDSAYDISNHAATARKSTTSVVRRGSFCIVLCRCCWSCCRGEFIVEQNRPYERVGCMLFEKLCSLHSPPVFWWCLVHYRLLHSEIPPSPRRTGKLREVEPNKYKERLINSCSSNLNPTRPRPSLFLSRHCCQFESCSPPRVMKALKLHPPLIFQHDTITDKDPRPTFEHSI